MGLSSSLWKQITVDLDSKTFSLKLSEKKKQFMVNGKITMHELCAMNFSVSGSVLVLKPSRSNLGFAMVVDAFEKMLEEKE